MISATPVPSYPVRRVARAARSEEHTSELQSQSNLVCRLLLEKKKHHTRLMTSETLTFLSNNGFNNILTPAALHLFVIPYSSSTTASTRTMLTSLTLLLRIDII